MAGPHEHDEAVEEAPTTVKTLDQSPPEDNAIEVLKLLADRNMVILIPFIVHRGINMAFKATILVNFFRMLIKGSLLKGLTPHLTEDEIT